MANIGSIMPTTERGIVADASGGSTLAQRGTVPNSPNRDYGVSAVQGKGPDGRVYTGQLIQRVYGSGNVRFYLKGEGHSHRLPASITSAAEAKIYSRQQITKGVWTDLPLGNQAAFNSKSGGSSASGMANIPNLPALDKGIGTVQGKAPDGTVLKGELIHRVYSTGYSRYYFKGQNDSHKLPPAITTTAEARVYARQQISSGRWNDFAKGDEASFDKGRGKTTASTGSGTTTPKFAEVLRVDFGSVEPKFKVGPFPVGERENIAAVNKAKYRGYLPDTKNPRFIDIPNNAKGGKDLAEINFSGVSYTEDCNPQTQCAIGLGGFENRGLKIPDGASPDFLESYKKTARLYGQQ